MRFLTFDQYEFDVPAREETLSIAVANFQEFATIPCSPGKSPQAATPVQMLTQFLHEVRNIEAAVQAENIMQIALASLPRVPFAEIVARTYITQHLAKYAGLSLSVAADCVVYVVSERVDDKELLLATDNKLVWYHWFMTA